MGFFNQMKDHCAWWSPYNYTFTEPLIGSHVNYMKFTYIYLSYHKSAYAGHSMNINNNQRWVLTKQILPIVSKN